MPTYGYKCRECGHEFEVFQKMTDTPVAACEQCSGPVKKLLYPVGIQFVGSGFHVNDYNRSSGARRGGETKEDTKTEVKTESTTETKAETKTEAKTERKPESKPTATSAA